MSKVTKEQIDAFLSGSDPMERIIKIECEYDDNKVSIIYRDEQGKKRIKRENFFPFVWCKETAAQNLFNGDRAEIKRQLSSYGIGVKPLRINRDDGTIPERMKNGYKLLFFAKIPMTYTRFMDFFKKAGRPIYPSQRDRNYGLKEYIAVSPAEQYMIQTGRRMFKGYDDYDDLLRMEWDLETEGLDPQINAISQIGIRTNKGYEKIITITGEGEEKRKNELNAICEFFEIIKELQPDVITGHNTENFDWNFIDVRLTLANVKMGEFTLKYFRKGVYKKNKQQVLKLGGEMEYYFPTVMWGTNLTDSLFAVRRAQAIDSNMKKATLKYVTKYSNIAKKNRVYVPGKIINTTWEDLNPDYAFNDENGHWFKVDEKLLSKTLSNGQIRYTKYEEDNKQMLIDHENDEKFEFVTGRYIVQRYLLDDLWETDKIELRYNQSNYLVGKMLPVSYEKMCTMGTAAIWKYIMLAWSYEHELAVPELISQKSFTGGLSRLLRVGYVDRIVKLDYNSLYPSIILTFGIRSEIDLMDVMSALLNYILTQREYYKELKGKYGDEADELAKRIKEEADKLTEAMLNDLKDKQQTAKMLKMRNDKMQLPLKITGNGFFGSYGSGGVFPWSDLECAEETTCTGRQMLRLMISHFTNIGYTPIVGDSVTYDTPIIVRGKDKRINIIPICDIFNNNEAIEFENEQYRDFSKKNYEVLTRNGWKPIEYVYKHKTNKTLKRIETKNGLIDCTEDHSLFDNNGNEVKPSTLVRGNKIETYTKNIDYFASSTVTDREAWLFGFFMADGSSVYCNRIQKYYSKRKDELVIHNGKRANWKISNKNLDRLNKAKEILEDSFFLKASIKDHRASSNVYDLVVENTENAKFFSDNFYTSYRYKKVPEFILNAKKEVKKAFLDGFCCGDGQNDTIDECIEFGQKSKVAMAGLYFLLKELDYNFRCHNRQDKPEFISFRFRNHRGNLLNEDYSNRAEDEVWNNTNITSKSEYVYDISADGTFINALGMIVCHNTDGFNFQMPKEEDFRYTKEHPYIGKGKGRNTKEGKEYTRVEADVAEFEDTYMYEAYNGGVLKNGLGVDEYCDACIQFSRKNYADLMPDGKVKLVGNSIKSKKMPIYIEKFLDKGIRLLLEGKGNEFLEAYYDYVEKIYNLQIPLKDIATVGKIKTSISNYQENCKQLTAGGTKKARQAWYELAIKHNLNVNMGDAIYYINTGSKKGDSDVKRVTDYFALIEGKETDVTKELEKLYTKAKKERPDEMKLSTGKWISKSDFGKRHYGSSFREEDRLIFNCILLNNEIIEDEDDHFCDDNFEYNIDKYVEMFNKKIKPLLVCFSKDIRTRINEKGKEVPNILISNPADRKQFTEEESKLVSGQPYNITDQDTYEQLMTMEDKEIKFWISVNKIPPYAKECGMDWEQIVSDYQERMKQLEKEEIQVELAMYNKAIEELTQSEVDDFLEEGIVPDRILKIVDEDTETTNFVSKKYNVVIGNIFDIIDHEFVENKDDD